MKQDAEPFGKAGASTAGSGAGGEPKDAKRPRGTGAAYVYDSLKGQILDLVLSPGTLLDETDLSNQLGVSRSPVREALIRLAAEGLVKTVRNRTSIVAPFDIATLPAYFDALQLLFRLTARLAASNPDAAKLDRIRAIHAEHEAALTRGDMRAIVRHNTAFHTAVADMTGNEFYAGWMRGLLDQGQRILRLYARHFNDTLPLEALAHHREMIAAIAAGDADAAEKAGHDDANGLIGEFQTILASQPTALLSLSGRPNKP